MRSQEEENEQMGMYDEDDNRLFKNTDTNGRFHSDWCSMIYSRLMLARNLLTEDGLLFVSIDDNENATMRELLDETLGSGNFVACIVWQKIHSIKNDAKYFSENHEYALVYAKNIDSIKLNLLPRTEEMNARYKNPDKDPRGAWQSGDLVASGERSNGHFIVKSPKTGKEFDIVTVGTVEFHGTPVYGGQTFSMKPHLHFIIGNDKTLEPFREYQGLFVNSDKLYTTIDLRATGKDLVNIEVNQDYRTPLGIECLTGSLWDEKGTINYSDDCGSYYETFDASLYKQIFSSHIRSNWGFYSKQKGIKDVMSFYLHPYDSDIAKILISIVIYKRNNQIKDLTEEDYNHIFDVLYKEKVDIIGASERDIPRTLTYVPNKKSGR